MNRKLKKSGVSGVNWDARNKRWKALLSLGSNNAIFLGTSKDLRETVQMRYDGEQKYGRPQAGSGWTLKYSAADLYLHPEKIPEQEQLKIKLKDRQYSTLRCPVCHAIDNRVSKYKKNQIKKGLSRHFCHICRKTIHFGCKKPRETTSHNICRVCGKKFYHQERAGLKPDLCRKHQIVERIKLRVLGERLETVEQNGKGVGGQRGCSAFDIEEIKMQTGCVLTRTKDISRCKKWGSCEHEWKCLCVVPAYWQGFTSDCVGYKRENDEWFGGDLSLKGTFNEPVEEMKHGSFVLKA